MKPGGKIGFFDSGLGGLVVLREVARRMPSYDYLYLGDTAHKPFGGKPAADIRQFTQQAMSYLFDEGCELVVLTCNTATAQALSFIQRQFLPKYAPHRAALGVIVPAAEAAVFATKTNRIGVIGTLGTVNSRTFGEEIQKLRPEATVYQQAAPELISLIDAGLIDSAEMDMIIGHYLQPLLQAGIDTLILGSPHYELIADKIARHVGAGVALVHEPPVVADKLQDYLYRHGDLSHRLTQGGTQRIVFTANAETFAVFGKEFYGAPLTAEEVTLR